MSDTEAFNHAAATHAEELANEKLEFRSGSKSFFRSWGALHWEIAENAMFKAQQAKRNGDYAAVEKHASAGLAALKVIERCRHLMSLPQKPCKHKRKGGL